MAPVQKTFTLIPQGPVPRGASPEHDQGPVRMTSKQAQKAYKAANRGPRLSRAERIRQERAEQERIRKEFDKEKAAARARQARDKKKEKEAAERQDKKRRGLPLVSVRPSQDTIARFLRGNGTGKKRGSGGNELRAVAEEDGDEGGEMPPEPAKKQKSLDEEFVAMDDDAFTEELELEMIQSLEPVAETTTQTKQHDAREPGQDDAYPRHISHATTDTSKRKAESETENPKAGKPKASAHAGDPKRGLSQSINHVPVNDSNHQTSELDDSFPDELALDMLETIRNDTMDVPNPKKQDQAPRSEMSAPDARLNHDLELNLDDLDDLEQEMLDNIDYLSPNKAPAPRPQLQRRFTRVESFSELELEMLSTMADEAVINVKPPTRRVDVIPKSPQADGYEEDLGLRQRTASRARMPPPALPSSPSPPRQAPPLSTQAILVNHDDFFPSLSQQARELEEDDADGVSPPPPSPQHQKSSSRSAEPDLPALDPEPDSEPEPQRRFFTSSGSHQLMSLALLRSRRSAAFEEQRNRRRILAEAAQAKSIANIPPPAKPTTTSSKANPTQSTASKAKSKTPSKPASIPFDDKENIPPTTSQESEYGGNWIDDIAGDLLI